MNDDDLNASMKRHPAGSKQPMTRREGPLNLSDPTAPDYAGPCPRCNLPVPSPAHQGEYPGALSRYDNKTFICSDCGQIEAMFSGHLIPFDVDLYSSEARIIRDNAKASK